MICAPPASLASCFSSVRSQLWSNQPVAGDASCKASGPRSTAPSTLPNFRFGTGETLPELKLHYLTLGTPHRNAAGHIDNAVLLLHGTGGNAHSLLNPVFSDVLFVPDGVLDITKYFLILPDDIGHGESSKPSDGLHAHFPAYDYDDMVRSQRMMLDEMKIDHLRLILGTSMGCMQSFVWGETYPDFMDALAPFACLPVQIAGRNRMMRYMAIQAIKLDPAWMGGEYKNRAGARAATGQYACARDGIEPAADAETGPHARSGRAVCRSSIWAPAQPRCERHDLLLQREPQLRPQPAPRTASRRRCSGSIRPTTTSIRPSWASPKRWSSACRTRKFILIPISDATRGHGTHTVAAVWKDYLAEFMRSTEPKQ